MICEYTKATHPLRAAVDAGSARFERLHQVDDATAPIGDDEPVIVAITHARLHAVSMTPRGLELEMSLGEEVEMQLTPSTTTTKPPQPTSGSPAAPDTRVTRPAPGNQRPQ